LTILRFRAKTGSFRTYWSNGMVRHFADNAKKLTTVSTGAAFACATVAPTTTVKPTTKTTA